MVPTLAVYHFDLYRFADPAEWRDAGFAEYFGPHSLCLLEWPEKPRAACHRPIWPFIWIWTAMAVN